MSDRLDSIKTIAVCSVTCNVRKMQREATEGETVSANHVSGQRTRMQNIF